MTVVRSANRDIAAMIDRLLAGLPHDLGAAMAALAELDRTLDELGELRGKVIESMARDRLAEVVHIERALADPEHELVDRLAAVFAQDGSAW